MGFSNQSLVGHSFRGQDLTGSDFSGANIRGADFSHALLGDANFQDVKAGLTLRSAAIVLATAFFLAVLTSFFTVEIGVMEVSALQAGQYTAISASFILLVTLPFFAVITVRHGVGTALRKSAISFALSMSVPLMISWMGLLKGVPSGAVTGIPIGVLITGLLIVGIGVFSLSITLAGLISNAWAWLVIFVGGFFILASIAGGLGFVGAMILAKPNTIIKQLIEQAMVDSDSVPELHTALEAMLGNAAPGSGVFAGAAIVVGSGVVAGLGGYLGWRILCGDERYVALRRMAVKFTSGQGTCFHGATLTHANFTGAMLKNTDFREAELTRTCWFQAQKLVFAQIQHSGLDSRKKRQVATTRRGANQNFDQQNLKAVNWQSADLVGVSLVNTNLSEATLQQTDLTDAILVRSQLDGTDLSRACLTGACIENWGITRRTKLDGISCQYIYLRLVNGEKTDRRPAKRDFQRGEFVEFAMSLQHSLELYHDEEINPPAAILALTALSKRYQQPLEILALEQKQTQAVLKLKMPQFGTDEKKLEIFKHEYSVQYESALAGIQSDPSDPSQSRLGAEAIKALEAKVSELAKLIENNKQGHTTIISSIDNHGIIITGGSNIINTDVDLKVIESGTSDRLEKLSRAVANAIKNLPVSRRHSSNYQTIADNLYKAAISEQSLSIEDKSDFLEQLIILVNAWRNPHSVNLADHERKAVYLLQGLSQEFSEVTKTRIYGRLLPALINLLKK
jgi:uncharacterized protein YjbI with pentapeptide repeats